MPPRVVSFRQAPRRGRRYRRADVGAAVRSSSFLHGRPFAYNRSRTIPTALPSGQFVGSARSCRTGLHKAAHSLRARAAELWVARRRNQHGGAAASARSRRPSEGVSAERARGKKRKRGLRGESNGKERKYPILACEKGHAAER